MNLGREEKKFYESAYQKFETSRQVLNDKNCFKLLERGIEDPEVCNKVRDILFEGQKDKVLNKQEFFKLLKFIAALQNGHNIDDVSIQDLPELPVPKLPKKSARETMRESKMGASGINLAQSEANGSVGKRNSVDEMEPVLKNSGNKENKMANHSDLMSQVLEKDSASRIPRDHEESKVETKNSRMKKSAMEELDEDLVAPGQLEKHTIQDVSGSVFIKDANMLSNPFGDDTMFYSMAHSKVVTATGPEAEAEVEEKIEKQEENNAVDEDDDKYDRIVSSKKRNKGAAYVFDPSEYTQFMENSQRLKIEITNATSNAGGRFGYGTYTTYKIKSVFPDANVFETEKRFSDFDWLNTYLKSHPKYKGLIFLRLPDKKAFGANEANFVQQRKSELEAYLKDLGRHPIISQDEVFRSFLGDEREKTFQNHRDSKSVAGGALSELDLHKMKEGLEYVKASVSTKLSKEEIAFDWKGVEASLNEVFELDNLLSGTQKFLQKIQEQHEKIQQLGAKLNITSTKIMNRIDDSKYYALGSLSSIFTAEVRRPSEETPIVEDFAKEVKYFRGKIEGVKQSHELILSCLQQILTYKELLKTKYGKIYEYQANNNQGELDSVNRDSEGLGQKIKALYTEAETIRDNLNSEIAELLKEFEVCFPNGVNQYYIKQVEYAKNVRESSRNRYED